jgi:rubrerythrin
MGGIKGNEMKKINKIEEEIRQLYNGRGNLIYCWRNAEILGYSQSLLPLTKEKILGIINDESTIEYLKTKQPFENLSDFQIKLSIERYFRDILIYGGDTMYKECRGDLHCVTGNDGDLQYIFICSECGTFIIDDHSADYQYNCPTMLCPICNPVNDRYPFEYVAKHHTRWANWAYTYSMYVKAPLLTKDELNMFVKSLVGMGAGEPNIIKRFWREFRAKRHYNKQVKKKWKEWPYFAGSDMSKVELKFKKGK